MNLVLLSWATGDVISYQQEHADLFRTTSNLVLAAFAMVAVCGCAPVTGNAREMMLEKNSDGIAAFFEKWIDKNVY